MITRVQYVHCSFADFVSFSKGNTGSTSRIEHKVHSVNYSLNYKDPINPNPCQKKKRFILYLTSVTYCKDNTFFSVNIPR